MQPARGGSTSTAAAPAELAHSDDLWTRPLRTVTVVTHAGFEEKWTMNGEESGILGLGSAKLRKMRLSSRRIRKTHIFATG